MSQKKLPNFLIVGAAKSGTTSLHNYIKGHPEICMPKSIKETFFLTGNDLGGGDCKFGAYGKDAIKSIDEYTKLFECNNESAIGEACVAYLYFYQTSISKIKSILGSKTKIIILLRNPVDRAYSNYCHHVRDGYEDETFERALYLEDKRIADNYWWGFALKSAGLYSLQIKEFQENFEHVKICLFDDLRHNPAVFLEDIFSFLNVDCSYIPQDLNSRYNQSGIPRNPNILKLIHRDSLIKKVAKKILPLEFRRALMDKLKSVNIQKVDIPSREKKYLQNYYREDIRNLEQLIGRDLSDWLQ